MSLSITEFLHNFSKPNITSQESFGMINDFQKAINHLENKLSELYHHNADLQKNLNETLKKSVPNETLAHQLDVQKQISESLQTENEKLKLELDKVADILDIAKNLPKPKTPPEEALHLQIERLQQVVSILQHNLRQQRLINEGLTKDESYDSLSVNKLKSMNKVELEKKCRRQAMVLNGLKKRCEELKEARDILVACLQEKDKTNTNPFWVDTETTTPSPTLKELGYEYLNQSPTAEDLKNLYKQLRGHKKPITAGQADVIIIDDPQQEPVESETQIHIKALVEELKRERADNKALSSRIESLEKQLGHLQEHNIMITACYNNQVEEIKRQTRKIEATKKLLETLDEVISKNDA